MTIATFTPPVTPSPGTVSKPKVNIRKAEFGDGYTQASPNGLNHIRQVVELHWDVLTTAQANSILAFLSSRGGVEPFLYAIPGEELRRWTCSQWDQGYQANGYRSITATFEQDFNITP